MKRRVIVVAASVLGIVALAGAQPVQADSVDNSSIGGWATATANKVLGGVPGPDGWTPRHVCTGVDTIDWGMCFTFPFPT